MLENTFIPGGLGKDTDKDKRSWVLLDDRKKYFTTDRKPKHKSKILVKYPRKS